MTLDSAGGVPRATPPVLKRLGETKNRLRGVLNQFAAVEQHIVDARSTPFEASPSSQVYDTSQFRQDNRLNEQPASTTKAALQTCISCSVSELGGPLSRSETRPDLRRRSSWLRNELQCTLALGTAYTASTRRTCSEASFHTNS